MATLNDYFRTEAHDFLVALERGLRRSPAPDAAELHRAVRGLRGTAQMAREQRIFEVMAAFEVATRSLAGGALMWTDDMAQRARATLDDLRALLDGAEDDEQLDARVSTAASRWNQPDSAPAAAPPLPAADAGTREFREFAAREAAGIADALDRGVQDLQTDPMDREPLRAILRRQRALLGAARLDEIPAIAEILRAVEDLTRVIAKLDIGVKREWLDIYRVARDGLQTTIAPLLRDEAPEPSHSVSRLRHMRHELLERYGSGAEEPVQHDSGFINGTVVAAPPVAPFVARPPSAAAATVPAPAAEPAPEPEPPAEAEAEPELLVLDEASVIAGPVEEEDAADAIEMDALAYTREDALQRMAELHEEIARAVRHDPEARDAVEELFDLIRVALG